MHLQVLDDSIMSGNGGGLLRDNSCLLGNILALGCDQLLQLIDGSQWVGSGCLMVVFGRDRL